MLSKAQGYFFHDRENLPGSLTGHFANLGAVAKIADCGSSRDGLPTSLLHATRSRRQLPYPIVGVSARPQTTSTVWPAHTLHCWGSNSWKP